MAIEIVDPKTGSLLQHTKEGMLAPDQTVFPLQNGVFRFAEIDGGYTASFGEQWNAFAETQLDEHGTELSDVRFFAETEWQRGGYEGENWLEVGSGAGRFTDVMLRHSKANIFSVDYSTAVDANFQNNGPHERLHLFQASIYEMPFKPQSFDKVVCLGVLQHTPDFRHSVECLAAMVKPGGDLVVDFYPIRHFATKLHAKYLLRPMTRRMSHRRLKKVIESNVGWLLAGSDALDKSGLSVLKRFLPICATKGSFPEGLDQEARRRWAVLDTVDMFSPRYDDPQRVETVRQWVNDAGLSVDFAGFVPFASGHEAAVIRAHRR